MIRKLMKNNRKISEIDVIFQGRTEGEHRENIKDYVDLTVKELKEYIKKKPKRLITAFSNDISNIR